MKRYSRPNILSFPSNFQLHKQNNCQMNNSYLLGSLLHCCNLNYTKLCKGNYKTTFKKHYQNHKKSFLRWKLHNDAILSIEYWYSKKFGRPWKDIFWQEDIGKGNWQHNVLQRTGKQWWWLKLINFVIKSYHPFVDSVKNNRSSK